MYNKVVKHRGIIHERAEDAPFMGALIIATSCRKNCQGCFNQHLKNSKVYANTAYEIIEEVKANPFNEGIILGGLEWSEDPESTIALVRCAKEFNLHVMIYTGLTEHQFFSVVPMREVHKCYIKFGEYDATKLSDTYENFGVKLASTNQHITFIP